MQGAPQLTGEKAIFAQLSNKFGCYPPCTISIAMAFHKKQQLTTWADKSLHLLLLNEKDITLDIKGDVTLFDLSYLGIHGRGNAAGTKVTAP